MFADVEPDTLLLDPQRVRRMTILRMPKFNMSSAEGPRFATVAREFTAKIVELGPSPLRSAKAA